MFKPNGSQTVKLEKGTKEGRNVVSQQNKQKESKFLQGKSIKI